MDQRTDAWFAARCGRVTASRIADVMARTKSGYGASRANYLAQLVCERLTGEVAPSFSNAAMSGEPRRSQKLALRIALRPARSLRRRASTSTRHWKLGLVQMR